MWSLLPIPPSYFTNTALLLSTLFGATDARRRRHSVCLCTRFRARNGTAAKNALCLDYSCTGHSQLVVNRFRALYLNFALLVKTLHTPHFIRQAIKLTNKNFAYSCICRAGRSWQTKGKKSGKSFSEFRRFSRM